MNKWAIFSNFNNLSSKKLEHFSNKQIKSEEGSLLHVLFSLQIIIALSILQQICNNLLANRPNPWSQFQIVNFKTKYKVLGELGL